MKTTLCPRCWGSKKEPERTAKCSYCRGQGVVEDLQLSPHFRLSELTRSTTAARDLIPNDPTPELLEALRKTAEKMEPIRKAIGCGIRVNSGLRLPAVNKAIGGSKTSAHLYGHAVDWVPVKGTLKKAMLILVEKVEEFGIDQLIYEGTWIHVGFLSPAKTLRHEKLMMFGGKYSKFDPHDPRVV